MNIKSRRGTGPYPRKALCLALATALSLSGCAVDPKTGRPSLKETFASDDPCSNNARNTGVLAGAIVGALVGSQLSKDKTKGALIGGALGGAAGGLIGHSMDARRCEIAKLSKKYNMDVQITPIADVPAAPQEGTVTSSPPAATASAPAVASTAAPASGLSINVKADGRQFASDSARLEPNAARYFGEVAQQYAYEFQRAQLARQTSVSAADRADVEGLKQRRLLLVGHTDDTGSSAHNAELSEQRARAVGEVFRQAGVAEDQIFYQGAGETLPLADNRTEAGRALNRRVEIVDLPDEAALKRYLAARAPRLTYYRPTTLNLAAAELPNDKRPLPPVTSQPAPNASKPGTKPATSAPGKPPAKEGKTPTKPAETSTAHGASQASANGFDFGGTPATTQNLGVQVAGMDRAASGGFSLISTAVAAGASVPQSCAEDRPRVARGVKSLRDHKEVSFTELMPGLYGSTWTDTVNGNLVTLSNVAVYRDGAEPATRPTLRVYRDFKGGRNARADFQAEGEVNTYRGDKALLYRVFVDGPVRCVDVVLPYGAREAAQSQLLYARQSQLYVAGFRPSLASQ